MEPILLAFITGLTTGGLSCLAVQGGLLASSMARQVERDLLPSRANRRAGAPATTRSGAGRQDKAGREDGAALPIALFLLAKMVAYTLLGALLGLVGSVFTFDPLARAVLLVLIGLFMVGNGLRMLNVHPFFRIFVIEPPRFVTRYIRQTSRRSTDLFTPIFLGALTVLIPCGITQAVMATALASGSPATGAALLFAFTLGTSPVFFLVAYLTRQLGARLESYFLRFIAIVVLVLGLVTVESGLVLSGSPVSFAALASELRSTAQAAPEPAQPQSGPAATATATASGLVVWPSLEIRVVNSGYRPNDLKAPANQPVSLVLVTENTRSCAIDFVIPALKYHQFLPSTGRTTVEIPPQKAGSVLRYSCSMGMYTGQIRFF